MVLKDKIQPKITTVMNLKDSRNLERPKKTMTTMEKVTPYYQKRILKTSLNLPFKVTYLPYQSLENSSRIKILLNSKFNSHNNSNSSSKNNNSSKNNKQLTCLKLIFSRIMYNNKIKVNNIFILKINVLYFIKIRKTIGIGVMHHPIINNNSKIEINSKINSKINITNSNNSKINITNSNNNCNSNNIISNFNSNNNNNINNKYNFNHNSKAFPN